MITIVDPTHVRAAKIEAAYVNKHTTYADRGIIKVVLTEAAVPELADSTIRMAFVMSLAAAHSRYNPYRRAAIVMKLDRDDAD